MDQHGSRLAWLFNRYQHNTCTPQERNEFLEMVTNKENHEEIKYLLKLAIEEQGVDVEMDVAKANDLYQAIVKHEINNEPVLASMKNRFPFRKLAIAASVIMVIGAGLYSIFFFNKKNTTPAQITKASKPTEDVLPGHDNAMLTLSDGTTIVLDSAGNGALAQQGNMKVMKQNGVIGYSKINGEKASLNSVYNTMTTARGNQYRLVLADGSQVWIGALSSIRFPTVFSGKERRVSITGEVYFEVVHNAKTPFYVDVNGMEVKVMGTHFNINAYGDEEGIKTTLLEGAVKVTKGDAMQILKPGEQADLTPDGSMKMINDVDVDEVVAWKDGSFIFNSLDIESIMRQISRWYDVEVSYQGKISKATFSGIVSRKSNLSQVLKIMEAGGVRFKIEDKKLIVM